MEFWCNVCKAAYWDRLLTKWWLQPSVNSRLSLIMALVLRQQRSESHLPVCTLRLIPKRVSEHRDPRPRDDTDVVKDIARELADIAHQIATFNAEANAYTSKTPTTYTLRG
jgi:hypothetical protein